MKMTRRSFMAAACAAAPAIAFPAVVKRRRPNEMLSHAAIGSANQAGYDLSQLASHRDLNVTAVCDVDSRYLDAARKRYPSARFYRDAFEMFAAEGNKIDSVNVSTPDHTHAQYIVEALNRGLNVYSQKPLCHDLGDCRRIERLAAEKGAVTQMGTQIAAWECDRRTVAALRNGVIGEVRHVWLFSTRRGEPKPDHFRWPLPETPVPETLEWKLWLGPAKWRPFSAGAYHPCVWRKWREFGTSWLGDLGLHLMSPIWRDAARLRQGRGGGGRLDRRAARAVLAVHVACGLDVPRREGERHEAVRGRVVRRLRKRRIPPRAQVLPAGVPAGHRGAHAHEAPSAAGARRGGHERVAPVHAL